MDNTTFLRALTILLLMACVPRGACGGDTNSVSGLLSANPLERQHASDRVLKQRADIIRELVSVIERPDTDKSCDGPLHRAIVLLGKLRAEEAVEPLADRLMFIPEGFRVEEDIPSEAYYVSAVALVQIGYPSINVMLSRIKLTQDQRERSLAGWVVSQIEGKEQASYRLRRLAETDSSSRAIWDTAAAGISAYVPTRGHPLKQQQHK